MDGNLHELPIPQPTLQSLRSANQAIVSLLGRRRLVSLSAQQDRQRDPVISQITLATYSRPLFLIKINAGLRSRLQIRQATATAAFDLFTVFLTGRSALPAVFAACGGFTITSIKAFCAST